MSAQIARRSARLLELIEGAAAGDNVGHLIVVAGAELERLLPKDVLQAQRLGVCTRSL